MNQRPMTIFLSAAEASGDEHASRLISAIAARRPDARFVGVAGPRMAAAGCEVLADLTAHASMLGGPFIKLPYYFRMVRLAKKVLAEIRPDVLVPVDSPAFNWHLCAAAKELGIPVVYYIAPQVWAWAPWRVKKLARLTDHVACILPFEERYLCDRGVRASFVGNPLFDGATGVSPATLPDLAGAWALGQWRVAMVPGSRKSEIRAHMPALLKVADLIRRRWPKSHCTFTAYTQASADLIRGAANGADLDIAVGRTREVLADSHFAVTKSGTVTLEVAHFGVPMVIFHRTSRLLGLLNRTLGRFRWAVGTKYFSLVNILAGREMVPELMPWHGNVRQLRSAVLEVMEDYGYLFQVRQELLDLTALLRVAPPATASDNVAQLVLAAIKEPQR
ncbi:MAG: lipid-A-disaccharide synthase [Phycisphaerae bacterium]|jgi:lipid-A-disaccharide synthase